MLPRLVSESGRDEGAVQEMRVVRLLVVAAFGTTLMVVPTIPAQAHYNCNVSAGHYAYVDPQVGLIWQAWGRMSCDHTHYLYLGQVKLQYKAPSGWSTFRDTGDKTLCCNNYSAEFDTTGVVIQCFYSGTGRWRSFIPTGNFAHQVLKFENIWTLTC